MSWIFKRFRVVMSMALVFSVVIAYFVIYLPMNNKLKLAALSCFAAEARSGERILSAFVDDCTVSVVSLSDDETVSKLLADHRAGRIDSGRLRTETAALFLYGLGFIDNVRAAFRFSDGMQVASYGTADTSLLSPKEGVDEPKAIFDPAGLELIVFSPIYSGDDNLGYDVVFFDMTEILNAVNSDRPVFSLLGTEHADRLIDNGLDTIEFDGTKLYDDGKYIFYLNRIEGTDMFFSARELKAKLFEPNEKTSILYPARAVIWYTILLVITNLVIIRFVQFRLHQAEKIKEQYREYAYRDTLTGAFSRLYFEQWSKSRMEKYGFINEDICVVMIDINRYKYINDTYGHAAGDKVLARVAKVLQMSVREEDLVVRYGGDEFLLVLVNCKYDQATRILSRISDRLEQIEEVGIGLSISYGIDYISSYGELRSAVERADEKMYQSKHAYNELLNF